MSHEQIRRALEDARNRTGMGRLPRVTVDASQLQHLLDVCDQWQERAEKAEAELARVRYDRNNLLIALFQIEGGDYDMGGHEDIAANAIAAYLRQEAGSDE